MSDKFKNAVASAIFIVVISVFETSTLFAQARCTDGIAIDLCSRARAVLDGQISEMMEGNISIELERRLKRAPERPLAGTPCFYKYGHDLRGVITKCIEARPRARRLQDRPVILEAKPFDACMSIGVVTGLNPHGDNYLSVLGGPSGEYREKDRLGTDDEVWICGQVGKWMAIIYPRNTDFYNCGVNVAVRRTQRYSGPCAQGWVHERYIKITSG